MNMEIFYPTPIIFHPTFIAFIAFWVKWNIIPCSHLPYSPDLTPWDCCLFPKVKMPIKGKCSESIQDLKAATIAHLKTLNFRDASESDKKDRISVFKVKSILRQINSNVCFTVIILYNFYHSLYFLPHLLWLSPDDTLNILLTTKTVSHKQRTLAFILLSYTSV